MCIWQEDISIEHQVALNMGDDDADEWIEYDATGSTRTATMEVDPPFRAPEPEPIIQKYNPRFDS